MTDSVPAETASKPCCSCSMLTTHTVTLCHNGVDLEPVHQCPRCFKTAHDDFEVLKAEFDAMIAEGVHRRIANARMIAKITRRGTVPA